jgi:hypothetical protein
MTKSYLKRATMGYPTDLTDKQWQFIEKRSDDKDRKRTHSLRSIFNGITSKMDRRKNIFMV